MRSGAPGGIRESTSVLFENPLAAIVPRQRATVKIVANESTVPKNGFNFQLRMSGFELYSPHLLTKRSGFSSETVPGEFASRKENVCMNGLPFNLDCQKNP